MGTFQSVIRGIEAGAAGTLAMDALLYRRYHDAVGRSVFLAWELSDGVDSWEDAPAPALVAKRLIEAVTKRDVPPRYARSLNNAMHWGSDSPTAPRTDCSRDRESRKCAPGSRSLRRSGPACTSCFRVSASTSRSGSTTSKRSRRT